MRKIALAIAALAIAVPFSAFAHGDEADATIDLTAAGGGITYVDVETGGVYSEDNGDAGLQTTAQAPSTDHPNGVPADSRVA